MNRRAYKSWGIIHPCQSKQRKHQNVRSGDDGKLSPDDMFDETGVSKAK
jgi:hypothetical protein